MVGKKPLVLCSALRGRRRLLSHCLPGNPNHAGLESSHDGVVKLLPPLRCRDTHKEVLVRVNFRPAGFS